MFGPTGPKHMEVKSEGGGDASRHGHLSLVDIKCVGFMIFIQKEITSSPYNHNKNLDTNEIMRTLIWGWRWIC